MLVDELRGESVCGGVVTGLVRVVTDPSAVTDVLPGEILVVPGSHPEYAIGLMQASGLICECGGVISHVCTVALELGIPCITEVAKATKLLKTSMRVTLDGDRGVVYGA